MKAILLSISILLITITTLDNTTQEMEKTILIKGIITVDSQQFDVVYYDNPTSRSLVNMMPFTVELKDYAGIEKIFYPEQSLDKTGASKGAKPSVGDIMYYEPWGDVAIFYKDFGYTNGLIPLGHIEDMKGFIESLSSTSKINFIKND